MGVGQGAARDHLTALEPNLSDPLPKHLGDGPEEYVLFEEATGEVTYFAEVQHEHPEEERMPVDVEQRLRDLESRFSETVRGLEAMPPGSAQFARMGLEFVLNVNAWLDRYQVRVDV